MIKSLITLLTLLTFVSTNIFATDLSELIGNYSVEYYGELTEKYKVKKSDTGYTLDEKKQDKLDFVWKDLDMPLVEITKEQFEKMAKAKFDGPIIGLQKGQDFLMFKASKGFTVGRFTTKSGYFAITNLGFMELIKK